MNRNSKYYAKNRDKIVLARREEYKRNPEKYRAEKDAYVRRHREVVRKRNRDWNKKNLAYRRKRLRALKELVLKEYGYICQCCGESRFEFMTVDHVQGGGNKHRKEVTGLGSGFYYWLKRNNFPKDGRFRLLCFNCNAANGIFGYCPHKTEVHTYTVQYVNAEGKVIGQPVPQVATYTYSAEDNGGGAEGAD